MAPPDAHLLITDGKAPRTRLSAGPKVNRHRPAIDVTFASAARQAGSGAVAVVLSGVLDDGAVGAALIRRAGGTVFVQDPAEAGFPDMPRAALTAVPSATVTSAAALGARVTEAIRAAPSRLTATTSAALRQEATTSSMTDSSDPAFLTDDESHLTRLMCPDCQGSLARVDLDTISYFRCHVGHQYSPATLAAAQAEAGEAKLWTAVSALEEQAALRRHVGLTEDTGESAQHLQAARRAGQLADTLRNYLENDLP